MAQEEDFVRLERFVEKMLEKYKAIKAECNALKKRLQEKEQENEEVKQSVSSLQNDRKDAQKRVIGLIKKIEQWEKSLDNLEEASSISGKKEGNEALSGGVGQPFTLKMEEKTDQDAI